MIEDYDLTIPDWLRRSENQPARKNEPVITTPTKVVEDPYVKILDTLSEDARKYVDGLIKEGRFRYHWLDDPSMIQWFETRKERNKEKTEIEVNKFKARIGRAKERSEHIPGSTWDPRRGRWVHPSLEKERDMPNAEGKTLPQLTIEYNALCNSPTGKIIGMKQIVKFRDLKTATERVKKALEKIKAKAAAPKESKAPKTPKEKGPKQRLPFTHGYASIVEEFDFKSGSEREKLLHILLDNFEKPVEKKKLDKLAGCIAGITWRINNKRLAYELRESKEDGNVSYGLYRKI